MFLCSAEGQSSYEMNGKMSSSFMSTLVTALKEEAGYMDVFQQVQNRKQIWPLWLDSLNYDVFTTEMKPTCESMVGRPRIHSSGMDRGITFHDDIMLDDEQLEDQLDQLQDTWSAMHSNT